MSGERAGDAGLELPRNLLTLWARLLIDGLAGGGVETLVASPGSRSTPFLAAALADPRLSCRVIVDERDAAFFALGAARASGRPAAFLCTSGTAIAHALPAVLEAERSTTPLLVISADRPPELQHCGASQTLDQSRLFGDRVRAFFDLGVPETDVDRLRALHRTAVQAVWASRWPRPGPVHVNAPARKPLEPFRESEAEATGLEERLRARVAALLERSLPRPVPPETIASPSELDRLARRIDDCRRVLLVVGALPPAHAAPLAPVLDRLARRGLPIAVEFASGLRGRLEAPVLRSLSALLASPTFRAEAPELVVQVGAAPLFPSWSSWLRTAAAELVVLCEHDWVDPTGIATGLIFGSPVSALEGLAERVAQRDRGKERLLQLDRRVEAGVAAVVAESGWCEAAVAGEAIAALPAGSLVAIGNSLPIRLVETHGGEPRGALRVLHQRGVNGIDGLVAGFAGALHALRDDPPTMALLVLGDVSLIHDLGGLAALAPEGGREQLTGDPTSPPPIGVLVIDNGGGRIFEQLPLAGRVPYRDDPAALAPWTTPHRVDFAAAARTFGLDHVRVESLEALRRELEGLARRPRPLLIQASVPAHGAAPLQRRLAAAVERVVTTTAAEGGVASDLPGGR